MKKVSGLIIGLILSLGVSVPAWSLDFTFARAGMGREILLGNKDFYDNLSMAEIAIRMGSTTPDKSVDDLKAVYSGVVEEWAVSDIVILSQTLIAARPLFSPWKDLFPETVYLVKVSLDVNGGMPHTRGDAIFLTPSTTEITPDLILHELFHILSRRQSEGRDSLYALLKFKPCALIDTAQTSKFRVTNPDAPIGGYYLPVSGLEKADAIMPHIYAARAAYDPSLPGGFAGHLGFGLLEVEVADGTCHPVPNEDGTSRIVDPSAIPEFFNAIGRNTGYIIHPEEVLADNFVYLATGKKGLPDPQIVELLRGWLETR